jgi:signal transduction histidine kinase
VVTSASISVREAVERLRDAHHHLDTKALSIEDRTYITKIECDWTTAAPGVLNSLERSDREEVLGSWLASRGIQDAWAMASSLVESGCEMETLIDIGSRFDNETLCAVLTRLTAWSTVDHLVYQLENGATRISSLVSAIRDYSYMDQAPEQEIDIHDGLDNTLLMLRYRLQDGIGVTREYDRAAPKVSGNGSELNQVWTNLMHNAIDVMSGCGELGIRTVSEYNRVLVEVRDTGPGIAPEIRDRIFEPFFTTKPVGEGTGLGLDIVYRIIRKHRGDVRVESQPGRTCFQVRIPAANTVTPAF